MKREEVEKLAESFGIDRIGVVDASPLEEVRKKLQYRRQKGWDTEFVTKDLERRIDPMRTMEGCRSIFVVAVRYRVDHTPATFEYTGGLSRSSWGEDYHRVVAGRLEKLMEALQSEERFRYRVYVDTGPLPERELARKAGLGFLGKNGCLIEPELGSFLFLGYALTDLALSTPPVASLENCGECTRCIQACPSGALSREGYDANRCISYLTQTKRPLTEKEKEWMGTQIYGCDLCQLACPYNERAPLLTEGEFYPTATGGAVDLIPFLTMNRKEFDSVYGSMSGAWRGQNLLKRNALIALVNAGCREEELFRQMESHPSDVVAETAAWARRKISNSNDSRG